jgi:uncharacterized alpha-E superfamily protein
MLSRVADGIYWMARYLERAENTARLINVFTLARLDWAGRHAFDWSPMLDITGCRLQFGSSETDEAAVVGFMLNDPRNPSSVFASLTQARENVRTLREILPRESWESINAVHQAAAREAASAQRRHANLREVIAGLQAIAGLFQGAMNNDAGYAALELGRNLERADFTMRVVQVGVSGTEELEQAAASGDADDGYVPQVPDWLGVLKMLTAYQMYRRSIRGPVSHSGVALFLLHSPVFPRALSYCAAELEGALSRFPNAHAPASSARDFRAAVAGAGPGMMSLDELRSFLFDRRAELASLHRCIEEVYFAPCDAKVVEPARMQSVGPGGMNQSTGSGMRQSMGPGGASPAQPVSQT